jgi:hypothetical protein
VAYSLTLADATSRVRFAVQDVSDTAPLLAEETYTALLSLYDGSEARATVAAAEALLVQYAQQPDKVEIPGAVKVEWAHRLASWRAIANGLRAELGLPTLGTQDNTLRVARFVRAASDANEFAG